MLYCFIAILLFFLTFLFLNFTYLYIYLFQFNIDLSTVRIVFSAGRIIITWYSPMIILIVATYQLSILLYCKLFLIDMIEWTSMSFVLQHKIIVLNNRQQTKLLVRFNLCCSVLKLDKMLLMATFMPARGLSDYQLNCTRHEF